MATKASDQISIIDITDSYTVTLTSEAYTFVGGTTYANAGSCSTQVVAYQGNDSVLVTVGTCTCPTGVTASVTNNGTASPTITFTVAANTVKDSCEVTIPLTVGDDVEFTKKFAISVAKTGAKGDKGNNITISSKSVTYQVGDSGTTAPTGEWSDSVPSVANGKYLWTKTYVKYSDGTETIAYGVSYKATNGTNGTSVTVSSTSVTYQASSSGTTTPTGTWQSTVPSVSNGQYLWTKTYVKYSDGKETTSYSVAYKGTNGSNGADAITISITSSAGFIFKNASIATTLTAHVYKGGKELTSSTSPTLASQGTIKWYKDGGTTAVGTGQTLTITAGDVSSKATYTAQLEG